MGPIADQALRIVISEDVAEPELATLLALQRAEEPDVKIGLFEATFRRQAEGLVSGLYDAGLARSCGRGEGLLARPVWRHTLAAAVPARSPLLAYKQVPLEEVLKYPMVLWHPETYEGTYQQVKRVLDTAHREPIVCAQVESFDLMMALVAAGYGVGLGIASRISACRDLGVVMRPLACCSPSLTTYLLRPAAKPSDSLRRFIERTAPQHVTSSCTSSADQ
jgi:DNA-binding transcriptional LysR family regulator